MGLSEFHHKCILDELIMGVCVGGGGLVGVPFSVMYFSQNPFLIFIHSFKLEEFALFIFYWNAFMCSGELQKWQRWFGHQGQLLLFLQEHWPIRVWIWSKLNIKIFWLRIAQYKQVTSPKVECCPKHHPRASRCCARSPCDHLSSLRRCRTAYPIGNFDSGTERIKREQNWWDEGEETRIEDCAR